MTNIVIVDQTNFQHAAAYYGMVTWEPVNGIAIVVGRVLDVRRLDIDTMLDHIISHLSSSNDAAIVVCHANPDGLILRLIRGSAASASRDALNLLSGPRSDGHIAGPLGLQEEQVAQLREKMRAVQELSLKRLEIRGCRVGSNEMSMAAIKRFFGVRKVGAPTVYNAYGLMEVHMAQQYDYSRYDNRAGGHRYPAGSSDQVGMVFQRSGSTGFRLNNVRATSEQGFRRWGNSMFPIRVKTSIPLFNAIGSFAIYLDPSTAEIDTNPLDDVPYPRLPIHFQLTAGDELYFPLEQNYLDNLSVVEHVPANVLP